MPRSLLACMFALETRVPRVAVLVAAVHYTMALLIVLEDAYVQGRLMAKCSSEALPVSIHP